MRQRLNLEELGAGYVGVVVEIEGDVQHGERRTWDYPGSPGGVDLESVRVLEYSTSDGTVKREDRPDWFAWLDGVVCAMPLFDPVELYERLVA